MEFIGIINNESGEASEKFFNELINQDKRQARLARYLMQLLLTSSGLTNGSLRQAFCSLLNKPTFETTVAFIPTAANVFSETPWLDIDIANLRNTGVGEIDLVDISRLSQTEVFTRCSRADVLWFNGGNTYYLLDWVRKSGLAHVLPELLTTRLYVGVSAGSMIAGPSIESNSPIFPEEDIGKIDNLKGLSLVPFAIIPHFLSPTFPNSSPEKIALFARQVSYPLYALDDHSAISVVDSHLQVVSEGQIQEYPGEA